MVEKMTQTDEFLEIFLESINVRVNLDQQAVTIGRGDWFAWDCKTQQMEIAPGVIHFIEPGENLVGIRFSTGKSPVIPKRQ